MPSATPAAPFKAAQDAALRGSTALASAMATGGKAILTEVPVNQPTPYVVFGENQVILLNGGDCGDEAEIFAKIDVWSRKDPRDHGAQAHAIGAAITSALNAQLTIDGWDVDEWEPQSERYVTDPDGSTHGILEFRYLLTQQT